MSSPPHTTHPANPHNPPLMQLGGAIGDWAAARSPNHGRVLVAQASVGVGVPLSVAVFKLLPLGCSGGVVAMHGVAFALWGLAIRRAHACRVGGGEGGHQASTCMQGGREGGWPSGEHMHAGW